MASTLRGFRLPTAREAIGAPKEELLEANERARVPGGSGRGVPRGRAVGEARAHLVLSISREFPVVT